MKNWANLLAVDLGDCEDPTAAWAAPSSCKEKCQATAPPESQSAPENSVSERNLFVETQLAILRSYALALCRNSDQADELVQDTVLRALRHWEQWRGEGHRAGWMLTIMRNAFRERLRKQRHVDVSVSDVDEALLVDAHQSVETNLHIADVDAALAQLSATQQETLKLASIDGLTYAQIAEQTQVPVGTVMSRLSRARLRVGELIGDDFGARAQPTSSTSNIAARS